MNLNKKSGGTIGITLTWFVATLVIFGILVIYIVIMVAMISERTISSRIPFIGRGETRIDLISSLDELDVQRELFSFSENAVIFDGKLISMGDATLIIIQPYFSEEIGGIVDFSGKASKEEEYFKLVGKYLKQECIEYIFKFPLGYSYFLNGKEGFGYGNPSISQEYYLSMSKQVISFSYQEKNINLELWRKRIC